MVYLFDWEKRILFEKTDTFNGTKMNVPHKYFQQQGFMNVRSMRRSSTNS